MTTLLLIAGCALFAASLVLPAYESRGFLKLGGPGWRVFWLSAVLGSVGFVAMVREGNPRAPLCLVPLALNTLMLALAALGLGAVRSDGVKVLGVITLLGFPPDFEGSARANLIRQLKLTAATAQKLLHGQAPAEAA